MASPHKKPIDLNLATEEELVYGLGITPRLAKRMILVRPYQRVEDLSKLWGIDADTLTRILPMVCVSDTKRESDALSPETTSLPTSEAILQTQAGKQAEKEFPQTVSDEEAIQELLSLPVTIEPEAASSTEPRQPRKMPWRTIITLGVILLIGAIFRFNNINWDQNQHQHPDERFLTMVAERIKPVSIGDYFNTEVSTLNPMQEGAGYTYGMLPLFITRMVGGWVSMTHYDKVVLVGRVLSGLFDLAAVLMLYFLGKRLFNRRVGFLAAALSGAAVLQIQLSHYFTVDSFSSVFIVAAFLITYRAVPILTPGAKTRWKDLTWYGLFGLAAGLAMACKINTIAIFGVLLLAAAADLISSWQAKKSRWPKARLALIGLVLSGLTAFVVFRVFQPYAFMGPGFFGLQLNPRWLQIMSDVTGQVAGNSDWPPNTHWTSRPVLYAWQNMVEWGLGVPLGLAAWAAVFFAVWRCFKGQWRTLLLPVAWVLGYFFWQNIQFWRYMRYFIPMYPILLLLAAWAMSEVLDKTADSREKMWQAFRSQKPREWAWRTILPGMLVGLGCAAIVGWTYLYAIAFSGIYTRPITRVAASAWMLRNIGGPLNVQVRTGQAVQSYPIAAPRELSFSAGDEFHSAFKPLKTGIASQISTVKVTLALLDLRVKLAADPDFKEVISEGHLILPSGDFPNQLVVKMPEANLKSGQTYYAQYDLKTGGPFVTGGAVFRDEKAQDPGARSDIELSTQAAGTVSGTSQITPQADMRMNQVAFDHYEGSVAPSPATVQVSVTRDDGGDQVLATASLTQQYSGDGETAAPVFNLPEVKLEAGKPYFVRYKVLSGGPLIFSPQNYTLETSWDDALPLRVEPYDALGGIYSPSNLELYDVENEQKRNRMIQVLDNADYVVLPSNRGYDAMPRLPERYPLATAYYQQLFDCSACTGDEIESKAYGLKPPFHSPLGFDLAATFTSEPSLGPFHLADEAADEFFTVYDHPKVLIFKKSADYSTEKVRSLFDAIDLSQVVNQQPKAVSRNPSGYRLSSDRLAAQLAGGTWSAMFNPQDLLNSSQVIGTLAWYILMLILGALFFPVTFVIFRRLPDKGYTLSRLISLLMTAWVAWLLASLKWAPFTRVTIALVLGVLVVLNVLLARKFWSELREYFSSKWRTIAGLEAIFAVLFLFQLSLRLGNPDLWNPWYGGEKPMDFSILNSVLKTVYFPPQNPWFAGFTLNYYYYGYVLAAIPIKLLGIVPSIAYNLVLPTWFALTGISIFGVAYNLVISLFPTVVERARLMVATRSVLIKRLAWIAGITAVVMMIMLGNLFQPRQLWKFLPEITNPDGSAQLTGFTRLGAVLSAGSQVVLGQAALPGGASRWFFDASRPILNTGPDTPIVEFPYFTYLYGDLHPHMLSTPYLFLALAWMLAFLLGAWKKHSWLDLILFWGCGGLVFGLFRAAHTWDYPTLVGMAVLVFGWTAWKEQHALNRRAVGEFFLHGFLIVFLSTLFYMPFNQWFATGYSAVELWKGARTPFGDYLSANGLFLFVLVTFLLWESAASISRAFATWRARPFAWLANPRKLAVGFAIGLLVIVGLDYFLIYDLHAFIIVLPLLVWIAELFFRKDQPEFKQLILALFGIGLCLTLLVEVVVLKGDNGRSNTVFYFYYQVWALFSLASAAVVAMIAWGWKSWQPGWRWAWTGAFGVLLLGAVSFPLTGTSAKLNTRWPENTNPPHSLDGMDYMLGDAVDPGTSPDPSLGAVYDDDGQKINLGLDYLGIRYLQDHVSGTPTIVEGQETEYRWGSRYSVYTGLPTVVGWSWHVRQHLDLMDGALVDKKINQVKDFYSTPDPNQALEFLRQNNVGYIVLGDLERKLYGTGGLGKFDQLVQGGALGEFFKADAGQNSLVIYQVLNTQ